jgi:hypothetical protein
MESLIQVVTLEGPKMFARIALYFDISVSGVGDCTCRLRNDANNWAGPGDNPWTGSIKRAAACAPSRLISVLLCVRAARRRAVL